MSQPTPRESLIHAIALFPSQQDFITSFVRRMQRLLRGIEPDPGGWTTQADPRKRIFGPVRGEGWNWHVLFDLESNSKVLADVANQCKLSDAAATAFRSHQAAGYLYLVEAPAGTPPVDRVRHFCRLAWEWLEMGATGILWPAGRKASTAAELKQLDPAEFTADDFEVCTSIAAAGKAVGGKQWLRTHGLGQFDLPDLACQVATGADFGRETSYAQTFFGSLPPYMIDRGGPLGVGETIEMEDQVWRCDSLADAAQSDLAGNKHGTQIFSRKPAG